MDRRIRTFLCTIIMLLSISGIAFTAYAETAKAVANSNEESWKAAYKDVLRTGYTEEILQGIGVRYTIWDISGDNQPELIVLHSVIRNSRLFCTEQICFNQHHRGRVLFAASYSCTRVHSNANLVSWRLAVNFRIVLIT